MDKSYFFDRFVMRRNYRELLISLGLGAKKIKELVNDSGMAYQHLCSVMQEAQKEKIVKVERRSNTLYYSLTKKGEVIKELSVGLKMCIEGWDNGKTVEKLNQLGFSKQKMAQGKKDKPSLGDSPDDVAAEQAVERGVVTPPQVKEEKKDAKSKPIIKPTTSTGK